MHATLLSLSMLLASASFVVLSDRQAFAQDMSNGADNFYKSDTVKLQKVSFRNKLGMTVVGNLFVPETMDRTTQASAIVVGYPMGAVEEQSSNL